MSFLGRFLRDEPAPPVLELVLFTRRACPLCEELEDALEEAGLDGRYRLERRNVDQDPELLRRYGRRVPVLEHAGFALAEGRASPDELRLAFERRASALARGS